MTENHYIWNAAEPPPAIEAHSVVKHEVLHAYLKEYVNVLCADPRFDNMNLVLVDGFAGGGMYLRDGQPHAGSPLVMLEAIREAEVAQKAFRRKDFALNCEYFFIEGNKHTIETLKLNLVRAGHSDRISKDVHLLHVQFATVLPELLKKIVAKHGPNRRCIFLLDQYGYTAVPIGTLQAIFATLKHAEVILNFAADHLTSFLTAENLPPIQRAGLDLDLAELDAVKARTTDWRTAIQHGLSKQLHLKSGAKHYTPFFITNAKSNRSYWLVHLSNHARARDVMIELHWQFGNQDRYFEHCGRSGFRMLGYHPGKDDRNQLSFEAYRFDSLARQHTTDAMRTELPPLVREAHQDGLQLERFFETHASDTPASAAMIKSSLAELRDDGEVSILRDGKETKASILLGTDVMIPPRRPTLFNMNALRKSAES